MNIFRLIFGLPMAALVTLGLLGFMAAMINKEPPPAGEPTAKIDSIIYQPPKKKGATQLPPKIDPSTEPDPPEIDPFVPTGNPGETFGKVGPDPAPPGEGEFNYTVGGGGPTIRVAPQYPSGCQSKGAEGTVIVQFDVTPEGNVVNPRIVESANSCFNRTVLRTVSRWKYAPDTSSGKATMRRGVVETFVFNLEE